MNKRCSVAQAKATLSECLREVEQGTLVVITRHGKPIAVLAPAEDVEQLERLRKAGPEGGLVSLAGGWQGSEDLVRQLQRSTRSKTRDITPLDI